MNLRRKATKEIEDELADIIFDISELNLRVQVLRKPLVNASNRRMNIGDRVRITNKYNVHKGP